LFFLVRQKRRLADMIVWIGFVVALPFLWAIYGLYEVGLSSLLNQQLILTGLEGERAVGAVSLIIQRLASRDPFTFLGLAGVLWALYRRDWLVVFPIAYLGAFVVFFLKISTVYLIPALPFLALVAAKLLFDIVDLLSRSVTMLRVLMVRKMIFGAIIIGLIVLSVFVVVTQSPANSQSEAVNFVALQHPPGVIMSATYLWLFQQNYPNITIYDRGSVPWSQLTNQSVYLIVDYPGDLNTISAIPQYQRLYQSSTLVWTQTTYGYTVQVLNGTIE